VNNSGGQDAQRLKKIGGGGRGAVSFLDCGHFHRCVRAYNIWERRLATVVKALGGTKASDERIISTQRQRAEDQTSRFYDHTYSSQPRRKHNLSLSFLAPSDS
ncbi:unnamed protein product, partial [Ectocarpus sp. 12 AP-2014]